MTVCGMCARALTGEEAEAGLCPACRPQVPDLLLVALLRPGNYLLATRDGLRVGFRQAFLYRQFVSLRGISMWTASAAEAEDLRRLLPPQEGLETMLEVRLGDILWVAGVVEVAPELGVCPR